MLRLVLCFALVLGLTASGVHAATPKDYARGSGTVVSGFGTEKFSFNAESDPAGGSPRGSMRYTLVNPAGIVVVDVFATVTCLTIVGDLAVISGDITKGNFGEADGLDFHVSDSGQPHGAGDGFAQGNRLESQPERACVPFPGLFPLDHGDITVFDQ